MNVRNLPPGRRPGEKAHEGRGQSAYSFLRVPANPSSPWCAVAFGGFVV
jgi:hypothetical protein